MTPAARPPNRATSAEAADPAGIDLYQLLVMANIKKKIKKEESPKPQAPSLKRVRQYVTLTQDVGVRQKCIK
jgi:hypothetical protein